MANNLFPKDIDTEMSMENITDETKIIGYKPAPYFDFETGDFLLNGSGQILTADEIEAYVQWCMNVVFTDRYNHRAYSDDIGIDYTEIFSAETREEAEAILESEITEALACDPYGRTKFVQSIEFDWTGPDEVSVNVSVIALGNEFITFSTVISK